MRTDNKHIAKNTLLLYVRMLFYIVISLYTSRVVISVLGVVDYGIYGVVGGVVAMFGFLQASMSGVTSRYLSYDIGAGNEQRLKRTFNSILIIHIVIAVLLFIITETIGLWLLLHKLSIPANRMTAVHWVYQFSILSAMVSIIQVPYNACIIAHEKMSAYAYFEILNGILKLLIVYLLLNSPFDKLIFYSIMIFSVSVLIALTYCIYCLRNFEECHFNWIWDKEILKSISSFSGWQFYGNFCGIVRNQGTTMLVNVFFGVIINTAASLASTVMGVLSVLSSNVLTAFRPPMIKCYASGDMNELFNFLIVSITFTSLLLSVTAIPIVIEMNFVLSMWLHKVPAYAVHLSQLAVIDSFIGNMNMAILIPIHAMGSVRNINLISGTLFLFNLFLLYVLLQFKITPYMAYGINYIVMLLVLISNSILLKKQLSILNISMLWRKKIGPITLIFILSFIVGKLISVHLEEGWGRMILVFTITSFTSLLFYWLFVFSISERTSIIFCLKDRCRIYLKR